MSGVIDKDRFAPIKSFLKEALSRYTLPVLPVSGQTYHRDTIAMLADARAAGVTQAQVDAFVRRQMIRDGHVKK